MPNTFRFFASPLSFMALCQIETKAREVRLPRLITTAPATCRSTGMSVRFGRLDMTRVHARDAHSRLAGRSVFLATASYFLHRFVRFHLCVVATELPHGQVFDFDAKIELSPNRQARSVCTQSHRRPHKHNSPVLQPRKREQLVLPDPAQLRSITSNRAKERSQSPVFSEMCQS